MKNITQFLLMLTLSFYIAFAPAVAYADPVTDKIDKLQIDLQKRVGDRWTLSPRNKSVGAGVEVGVSQSYPVTATTTATTAAGATTSNTATLTAQKIGSKIFTPTTARIAKSVGTGVVTSLIAIAIYDALGKAVDYVMDPANNRVTYQSGDGYEFDGYTSATKLGACAAFAQAHGFTNYRVVDDRYCFYIDGNYSSMSEIKSATVTGSMTYDEIAKRAQDIANNPAHKDVATAQSGIQTVVNDMITNNEIDNSYFNDADISNDTYNDVTNNYVTNITNQYPSVSVPSQSEMAQAAANGQSSVTKTTQNANGTTTTTTTNFSTTNNSTTNNNTYNITNITVNNPVSKDDTTASAPASTPSPASTPKPTDSKPFELPAFCDWAKPVCDFIDWVKKDDTSDTDVDVDVPQTPSIDTDINFGGSCPANVTGSFVIGGRTTTFNIMDWSQFCIIMSTYLKPLVIALASYQAVKILAGRNESN